MVTQYSEYLDDLIERSTDAPMKPKEAKIIAAESYSLPEGTFAEITRSILQTASEEDIIDLLPRINTVLTALYPNLGTRDAYSSTYVRSILSKRTDINNVVHKIALRQVRISASDKRDLIRSAESKVYEKNSDGIALYREDVLMVLTDLMTRPLQPTSSIEAFSLKLIGLMLCTGSRFRELFDRSEYSASNKPGHIVQKNLAKKKTCEQFERPVLFMPVEVVLEELSAVRKYIATNKITELPLLAKPFKSIKKRLFTGALEHFADNKNVKPYTARAIYAAMCYEEYGQHDLRVSQVGYMNKVLCHGSNLAVASNYNYVRILRSDRVTRESL